MSFSWISRLQSIYFHRSISPKMTIFPRALTGQTDALHRAQARYVLRFRRRHGCAASLTQDRSEPLVIGLSRLEDCRADGRLGISPKVSRTSLLDFHFSKSSAIV